MTDQRAPGRPRTRESRVRLHLEIDAEIAEQLDQQAAETGKPRWQIVQEAMAAYWCGRGNTC